MNEKLHSPHSDTVPVNFRLVPESHTEQDDGIDLYNMLAILFDYRVHIASTIALCTLIALLYVLVTPSVYQAKLYLSPPQNHDLVGLDDDSSPQTVFKQFLDTFNSRALRLRYFEENDLYTLLERDNAETEPHKVYEKYFNDVLTYEIEEEKNNRKIVRIINAVATLEVKDRELSATLLNNFADEAGREAVAYLKKDIVEDLKHQKEFLLKKLDILRRYAEKSRQDTIARLNEKDSIQRADIEEQIKALKNKSLKILDDEIIHLRESLSIAKILNINEFLQFVGQNITPLTPSSPPKFGMNLQSVPAYTRGTKALGAEITALNSRKQIAEFNPVTRELEQELELLEKNSQIIALKTRQSDDPYIDSLRDIERQLDIIDIRSEQLATNNSLQAAVIEQYATPPDKAIKPRRLLIILFGIMIGAFLGIFVAIMLYILSKARMQTAQRT